MDKQERVFWEFYNPIQAMADKHDVSIYTIVNIREIFDYAYAFGKADGTNEMLEILSNKESN